MKHQQMGERLKEYNKRLRMLLKSDVNAKNKIAAIRTLAVPLLKYSSGIINWRFDEIRKTDRKTRNVLVTLGNKISLFFLSHEGKYQILIQLLTLNSNM